MDKLKINGQCKLEGEIRIHGSKNSILPLLCASLLPEGKTVLTGCPDITDVGACVKILKSLGAEVVFKNGTVEIKSDNAGQIEIKEDLMREMRSSIVFLGAVLTKNKKARLSHPGGCELGPRPIDIHIKALKAMGVDVFEEYGYINCIAEKGLRGAKIELPFPSVGATENILLAAVCATGRTEIRNAAREPEIVDLCNFLIKCGAQIQNQGSIIYIDGVKKLSAVTHRVIPDRIVAATTLCAAAATGSEIIVKNVISEHVSSIFPYLGEAGCIIKPVKNKLYFKAPARLRAPHAITTMPFPGFPTDAQAILMASLLKSEGTAVFSENIFLNRYRHAAELSRMGADIKIYGKVAVVRGVERLSGANLKCTDLRGGAAMVIAALAADGETTIEDIYHIDRGYEAIERQLRTLGADIKRI